MPEQKQADNWRAWPNLTIRVTIFLESKKRTPGGGELGRGYMIVEGAVIYPCPASAPHS